MSGISNFGNEVGQFIGGIVNPVLGGVTDSLGKTTTTETTKDSKETQSNYRIGMYVIVGVSIIIVGVTIYLFVQSNKQKPL